MNTVLNVLRQVALAVFGILVWIAGYVVLFGIFFILMVLS